MLVWIMYNDRFWEFFFQNVGCDETDISEDWLRSSSAYPICCTNFGTIFVLLFYIYINKINILTAQVRN